MSNTIQLNNCPNCGLPIPQSAPQGLCPKCVLGGAAVGQEGDPTTPENSEVPSLERVASAFPQLEVVELIGRGGMGFVYKCRQPHLDRFVALKLLPDKLARDPRFTERFNREGRVLARLSHPNIVSIYDFGQTEHFYFLVMEYVDGVNLRQAMQTGRFSPAEALTIVPKICEALQYAHEQGILHRDIKPANILLDTKGNVKIADFGIAKLAGETKPDVTLTATGMSLGTPQYMAPEQLEKPSEVDHRADIYSLGVVFYEMLTGELPIGRFAAPSSKTPVGANVDEVVFRTLEKDRERRYQSAGEMKTQVEYLGSSNAAGLQNGLTPASGAAAPRDQRALVGHASTHPGSAASAPRSSWKPAWIALLLAAMGLLGAAGLMWLRASRTAAVTVEAHRQEAMIAETVPWIRFTFTAVELRETAGVRRLAIDYLDDVHGAGQKAFPWESTIAGFKPTTTTSEFLKDDKDFAPVRHQRAEYLLPELPREQLEEFRASVEKKLLQKSIRLELGDKALLFDLSPVEGQSLKAWVAVLPPLDVAP